MKVIFINLIVFLLLVLSFQCKKDTIVIEPTPSGNSINSDTFNINFDNENTIFMVHKSTNYNANQAVPLVLLLHGTHGDAYNFYDKANSWYDLSETENIITVYVSSKSHDIIDGGNQINDVAKWNAFSSQYQLVNPSELRDDVQYLRNVLDTVKQYFNVNEKQMYLLGFSNGGEMAFRCGVEMTDVFSAIIESSGSNSIDTLIDFPNKITTNPDISFYYQLGNKDAKMLQLLLVQGWSPPQGADRIPLSYLEHLFDTIPGLNKTVNNHLYNFGFDSTTYNMSGDLGGYRELSFSAYNNSNTFTWALFDGLGHTYSSSLTQKNWNWMKQFSKP